MSLCHLLNVQYGLEFPLYIPSIISIITYGCNTSLSSIVKLNVLGVEVKPTFRNNNIVDS